MLYHLLEEPAVSQISGIPPSQKCHSVATATLSEHCTKLHCTITQFRCSNVKCSNVQMFNISNLAVAVVSEHCAKLQRTIIQQWLRNTRVLQDRLLIAVCRLLKLNHVDDYHRMNVYVCASCNILTTIIANIFVLKKGCVRCTRNLWNFDYYHHLYVPSTQCKYHLCKLCHFDDDHQVRKRHHCPAHLWPPTNPREGLLHYSLLPNIAKHINWPFVQIVQMSKFPNVSMLDKKRSNVHIFMKGTKCPNFKMLQCQSVQLWNVQTIKRKPLGRSPIAKQDHCSKTSQPLSESKITIWNHHQFDNINVPLV